MSYATPTHLQERYPTARLAEISDPLGQAADSAKLQVAVDDASAEIDSYLGRRYLLPLASVPPVLRRLACDIAIYRLMSLLDKESVEDARKRYQDALAWLQAVVEGSQSLPDGSGSELPSNTVAIGGVRGRANDRIFDPFSLGGYQ